jgi:hypothetical protein
MPTFFMEAMMKKTCLLFSLFLLWCFTLIPIAKSDQEISATIYNQNFAVIKDTRSFDLSDKTTTLEFSSVAAKIDPTSVQITNLTNPNFSILEQNFEYNLLSVSSLLNKIIDQPITILLDNNQSFSGKLLASDNRAITIKSNEDIKIIKKNEHLYQLSIPKLPEDFFLKPTLIWQIETSESQQQKIEIAYQTSGFNWLADYNVLLKPETKTLDLNGWVSITNNSGATYPNANLKLVAGDVHKVKNEYDDAKMLEYPMQVVKARAAKSPAGFEERSFAEYHLYDLGRKTTLKDNETKQIEFINIKDVAYSTSYLFTPQQNHYWNRRRHPNSSDETVSNLHYIAIIENKAVNNLGIPLPAGNIRMYQKDSQSLDHFLGQDTIDHTPKDEEVKLKISEAFDVIGSKKVESLDIEDSLRKLKIVLKINNHKNIEIPVTAKDYLDNHQNWTITQTNTPYVKKDHRTIEFTFTMPANSQKTIRYEVQYKRNNW